MRYATSGFAITPSDSVDLPGPTTAGIYVATAGTLTVTLSSGAKISTTVPTGLAPLVATRVWSTGTAASGLTGLIGNG